jgi:hypothetical protein
LVALRFFFAFSSESSESTDELSESLDESCFFVGALFVEIGLFYYSPGTYAFCVGADYAFV